MMKDDKIVNAASGTVTVVSTIDALRDLGQQAAVAADRMGCRMSTQAGEIESASEAASGVANGLRNVAGETADKQAVMFANAAARCLLAIATIRVRKTAHAAHVGLGSCSYEGFDACPYNCGGAAGKRG